MLKSISPIDGRFYTKTQKLSEYFSEFALIRHRIFVEVQYFIALVQYPLPELVDFDEQKIDYLNDIFEHFTLADAQSIKSHEETNHDEMLAIQHFIKSKFDVLGLSSDKEFIHFGLSAQDIDSPAFALMFQKALNDVYFPVLNNLIQQLRLLSQKWKDATMLSYIHGQPSSPTTADAQILVFIERLEQELEDFGDAKITAKFGGTSGNLHAHYIAYPNINWHLFADSFIREYLGLTRQQHTTRQPHNDGLVSLLQKMKRINTILIDFAQDLWQYHTLNYLVPKSHAPNKTPVTFEKAESNLDIANTNFQFLAEKLPLSLLQGDHRSQDLMLHIGMPISHSIIGLQLLIQGLANIELNREKLWDDLENNWVVVLEGIQSILLRERFPNAEETIQSFRQHKNHISANDIYFFIGELAIPEIIKEELRRITPHNYVGR